MNLKEHVLGKSFHSRVYAAGWTDGIENRDPTLEYRLTIENAGEEDSGSFSCITPSRHGHEIKIHVKSETQFFVQSRLSVYLIG